MIVSAPRPPLMLPDEPLGAPPDPICKMSFAIWEQEKSTVVMVMHDVEEAIYLSDRVVVMEPRPGRIASIFDIAGERPRQRHDPGFVVVRREITNLLARR